MKASIEENIAQYVAAWNEKGFDQIKAAFALCWAEEAAYTDPDYERLVGLDSIANLANDSYKVLPVRHFKVLVLPVVHHNCGRYTWGLEVPGEEPKGGMDYFEFNSENKITRLVSFFGSFT